MFPLPVNFVIRFGNEFFRNLYVSESCTRRNCFPHNRDVMLQYIYIEGMKENHKP